MKHLPKIIFRVVPHCKNRNNQCDDYFQYKGLWHFTVSKMNAKYEFLVFIHAFVEWGICIFAGIKEKDITAFDKKFELERSEGLWKEDDEPGDDPRAPYQSQHRVATSVEMLLAPVIGVDYSAYDEAIRNL